ncbi:MAG: type 4a pilus biogenesis protein PilO [Candidatus Omnitrophota bacterium]
MKLSGLINKNRVFNASLIILAVIVAGNIYKGQGKGVEALKKENDMEIKKNTVMNSLSKGENDLDGYKNIFVKKDAGSIINTLSNIAKESGVKIKSIKPAQEQKLTYYIKTPFNLALSVPGYHALGGFISKLENYRDAYLVVEAVDIRSETQGEGLNVNLMVNSIVLTN